MTQTSPTTAEGGKLDDVTDIEFYSTYVVVRTKSGAQQDILSGPHAETQLVSQGKKGGHQGGGEALSSSYPARVDDIRHRFTTNQCRA